MHTKQNVPFRCVPRSQSLPAAPSGHRQRAPVPSSSTHVPRPSTHANRLHEILSTSVGLDTFSALGKAAAASSDSRAEACLCLDLTRPRYRQPFLRPEFAGRRLPLPVAGRGRAFQRDVRVPAPLCLCRCRCLGRLLPTDALIPFKLRLRVAGSGSLLSIILVKFSFPSSSWSSFLSPSPW